MCVGQVQHTGNPPGVGLQQREVAWWAVSFGEFEQLLFRGWPVACRNGR